MKRLLPLLLLLLSPLALAEAGVYRVEVIIFQHLRGQIQMQAFESDPGSAGNDPGSAAEELRSFSQFPALVKDLPINDLPDDLLILGKLSSSMGRVWRRLRSSADYHPLVYAAWEQNRVDYYPPIRIHDQQVIDEQLRPPTPIMIADLSAQVPLAAYRSVFYRLDGSVQLRRSRFLHLFVDLVYREETQMPAAQPGIDDAVNFDDAVSIVDLTHTKPQYAIFSLRQNRQISTGKLQYFDTPFLGALVLVTSAKAQGSKAQGSDSNAP